MSIVPNITCLLGTKPRRTQSQDTTTLTTITVKTTTKQNLIILTRTSQTALATLQGRARAPKRGDTDPSRARHDGLTTDKRHPDHQPRWPHGPDEALAIFSSSPFVFFFVLGPS
jgi:hypothetical protein